MNDKVDLVAVACKQLDSFLDDIKDGMDAMSILSNTVGYLWALDDIIQTFDEWKDRSVIENPKIARRYKRIEMLALDNSFKEDGDSDVE